MTVDEKRSGAVTCFRLHICDPQPFRPTLNRRRLTTHPHPVSGHFVGVLRYTSAAFD